MNSMSAYTNGKSKTGHGVRNRQDEYLGRFAKNIVVLEFWCGRKVVEGDAVEAPQVTCKTCLKSIAKQ